MFRISAPSPKIKRSAIDYVLVIALVLLLVVGTLSIISAVAGTGVGLGVVRTHGIAILMGIAAFLFGWAVNYRIYEERWKWVYAGVIILLVGVLLFGSYQRGSKSWFVLPFFSVQPSEICRVALILIVAGFLERYRKTLGELGLLLGVGFITLPIFGLIMMQPDFSSIVVTVPALFFLLYCAGISMFLLLLIALLGVSVVFFPILWTYIGLNPPLLNNKFFYMLAQLPGNVFYMLLFAAAVFGIIFLFWRLLLQFRIRLPWFVPFLISAVIVCGFFAAVVVEKNIKPHQRKRVEVFLAPKSDPRGAGYNVLQAQIAMGSGGILGKGLFSGTQSQLGFVPEKHTDFILSVVGEEMGIWGTLGVLGLYFLILWRILLIGYRSADRYGYLVCAGIFGMFLTYAMINFGMLIGLVPVAGIPLPLISYGGSNLVASLWAFGVVESVYARKLSFR